MHFCHLVGLTLGLTTATTAFPQARVRTPHSVSHVEKRLSAAYTIYDFLISDLGSESVTVPGNGSVNTNQTLHFTFTDANSNTSATCNSTWTQSDTINNAPFSYVECTPAVANATDPEFFIWQFTSFTNISSFQLELAHQFSDPIHYPPPYNYVEYFSDNNNFTLTCVGAAGNTACLSDTAVRNATIDQISN